MGRVGPGRAVGTGVIIPGRAVPVVTPNGLVGAAAFAPARRRHVVVGLGLDELTEAAAQVRGRFRTRRRGHVDDGGLVVGVILIAFDWWGEAAERLRSWRPHRHRATPGWPRRRRRARGQNHDAVEPRDVRLPGRTRSHDVAADAAEQRLERLLLVRVLELHGDGRPGKPFGVHDAGAPDPRPFIQDRPDSGVLRREVHLAAMERDLDRLRRRREDADRQKRAGEKDADLHGESP